MGNYKGLVTGIGNLLEEVRNQTYYQVNRILVQTYWEIGRRIVEFEQGGKKKARFGEKLLDKLSKDLKLQCGRVLVEETC